MRSLHREEIEVSVPLRTAQRAATDTSFWHEERGGGEWIQSIDYGTGTGLGTGGGATAQQGGEREQLGKPTRFPSLSLLFGVRRQEGVRLGVPKGSSGFWGFGVSGFGEKRLVFRSPDADAIAASICAIA